MEPDQAFLEYSVKALVDHPESVETTRTIDQMGVLLTLTVDASDMGKIIGRQGNTAKAVRTLLRVVGMKNNSRVNLKINEPVGGKRVPFEASAKEGICFMACPKASRVGRSFATATSSANSTSSLLSASLRRRRPAVDDLQRLPNVGHGKRIVGLPARAVFVGHDRLRRPFDPAA